MFPWRTPVALVVGAHPDDEIGCGGLIARLADEGIKVHHYYFSTCAASTRDRGFPTNQLLEECEASRDILGIDQDGRGAFGYQVRTFPSFRQNILDDLIELRHLIDPSVVLTASRSDVHQDHSTLTNEVVRAFKFSTILGYEMPWNSLVSRHDLLVALSAEQLERKLDAAAAYKTQAGSSYFDPEFVKGLARVRGVQANTDYAEGLEVMRMVV